MPITDSGLEGMFTFGEVGSPSAEEPPFHVLFLGDWSGDGPKKDFSDRRALVIDRDNFDSVMERFGVAAEIDLDGERLRIEFRGIDDFNPDRLYRDLPVFAGLRELRRRLRSADDFEAAAGEVRAMFGVVSSRQSAGHLEPEPQNKSFSLEDILEGSQTSKRGKTGGSELDKLIASVVGPYLVKIDETEQAQMVSAVDSAIADVMRKILRDKRFKAVESAWRGLHFAVRRVETDVDLKLFALDLSKDECAANLKSCNNLEDSVLGREVVSERLATLGADPFAVLCANYEFGLSVDDVATLMRMGRVAASAAAPVIGYVRPEMFGISNFEKLPEASGFQVRGGTDAGKLWSALRSVPEAKYLGLLPMRWLARAQYGAASDSVEGFEFEEFDGPVKHEELLWANPAFFAGTLLAKSYRAFGWDMGGVNYVRELERLAVCYLQVDGESRMKPCAESWMTDVIAERLLEAGLMPLIAIKDSDRVRIARFQAIAEPVTALGGRWRG